MEIKRMHTNNRMSGIVEYNDVLYFAGLVSYKETFAEQFEEIVANFEERLTQAGSDKTRLLTAHIVLTDTAYFDEFNTLWEAWLEGCGTPTRATVIGALVRPVHKIEIIFTAAAGK
ncbi:MAG: RidA family protein [Defluviitaleaceae bacterium]|nr:RidA family protein [Defluviitaleaceae bacterium]